MGKLTASIVWDQLALQKLNRWMLLSAEQTAYAIRTDVEDASVVPFAVGTLQGSGHIDPKDKASGHFYLVYSTPYARRLYWHPEYHFRTTDNANARGEWLKDWLTGSKRKFAKETFIKRLRINAGLR